MRSDNYFGAFSFGAIFRACALPIVAKAMILTALLVTIMVGNCYGSMIIDSFDVSPQFLMVIPGINSTASGMNTGISSSEVIGGSRDIAIESISGTGITLGTVDFVNTDTLNFAEGPATESKLSIIWDGDTSSGLNGFALAKNLTSDSSTRFVIDLASIDLPILFRMEVYTDASNASVLQQVVPGGTTGPVSFDFASFSTLSGSGASFNNVGAIKLLINGQGYPDTDLSINSVSTAGPIPEPANIVLLLSGLLCLGLGLWRKKK